MICRTGPLPDDITVHLDAGHDSGMTRTTLDERGLRFARIDRVRTVLAADAGGWADIAATAGYYDQSHMTAEFRHFMGVPSAEFTAGRRPAATSCTA